MKDINSEWIFWLSYEKDEHGEAKLKEDTQEYIKKQYEKHQQEKMKFMKTIQEDEDE